MSSILYYIYDYVSTFLPSLTASVFMKKNAVIEFKLSDDFINNDANGLGDYLYSIQHEFNYLLNQKFSSGPAQFVSLFDMTRIRFIQDKLVILIMDQNDAKHVLKVFYFLKNQHKADSCIRPLLSTDVINDVLATHCSLKDKQAEAAIAVEQLVHNIGWRQSSTVRVVCRDDGQFKFFNIKAYDLYYLLHYYNVLATMTQDGDFVFCLDNKLFKQYQHLLQEPAGGGICDCQEFKNKIFFIISLDGAGIARVHQVFVEDFGILFEDVFCYRTRMNVEEYLKVEGFYLSEIRHVIMYAPSCSSGEKRVILSDNRFGLGINLGVNSNIEANVPFASVDAGIKVSNLLLNQSFYSVMALQSAFPNHLISQKNPHLDALLHNNVGFFVSFFLKLNLIANVFSVNYAHFREYQDKAVVSAKSGLFLFGFINKFYLFLIRHLHFQNQFLNTMKDANLLFSAMKVVDVHMDDVNDKIEYNEFTKDEKMRMVQSLYDHGFDRRSAITSLKNDLMNSILANKYIKITYFFTKGSYILFEYGIRNSLFSMSIFANETMKQFILCNATVLPSIFYQLCHVNHLCEARVAFDSILVYNLYSRDKFYNSIINRTNMSSIEVIASPWLNRLLKIDSLRAYTNVLLDKYTRNNSVLSLVHIGWSLDKVAVDMYVANKLRLFNYRLDTQSPVYERVDFLADQFLFCVKNSHFLFIEKHLNNFMINLDLKLKNKKHMLVLRLFLDVIANNTSMKMFFDFGAEYFYKLISIYSVNIYIKFTLKVLRDNLSPISLVLL